MAFYKQSTAYTRMFKMIDSADHFSKKTGLTCTVNLSKAGAAFGAAGGTITEVANGWYKIALTTTDTNTVGDLAFYITATGADDTDFSDQVWVRDLADLAFPATSGRSMVVDASGLVDANTVKLGPTGSGTAQTAKDVGGAVPSAAAGTSGGLLISGSNAGTTTFAALTITGATTHTGNVVFSDGITISSPSTANRSGITVTGNGSGSGLSITGGAAVTTTAAGSGLSITGGAASTGAGGVSGAGIKVVGGAGAASTNGSAIGVTFAAGGTTTVSGNDGLTVTGTGNGNGATLTHAGSGQDFNATTTSLTLAKGTNITGLNDIAAAAIVSSGAITTSGGAVSTVTTVTNQLTAAAIATGVWQDSTAGDFTAASSIGKSLYTSGVVPGGAGGLFIAGTNAATTVTTSFTTTFTGNLTGSVGSVTGLTASNLDATISSRMATYTQPTGFLVATFPTGTVANTTNITAGTITTATNLTNAPANGDFTAAMKTSLNAATPVVTISDKTGFSLTSAYDAAKTASQAGDVMKVSSGTGANQINLSSGTVTVGTNNDKTGYALTAAYDNAKTAAQLGDAMTLTSTYNFAKGTAAMTESYAAQGASMTPIQALYQTVQHLGEQSISGTTKTLKKRDGSTTAKTYTLDSATIPTSITEVT